jgi:hypothetical protein
MSQPKLAELHGRYQARKLTANDYAYLANLMNKVETTNPRYSHKNLLAIYACQFWINRYLANEKSEFISSLDKYLQRKLALTPEQIDGLNNWFKNRPGMLSIKLDAFSFNPAKT